MEEEEENKEEKKEIKNESEKSEPFDESSESKVETEGEDESKKEKEPKEKEHEEKEENKKEEKNEELDDNLEKDENKKETQEKPKEKISEKQDSQLKWIIAVMAIFVIGIFFFAWFGAESKTYEYIGLTWQKEMFGNIPIHTTVMTGQSITGQAIGFKMPFRNDPRKLNIPIEGGDINYILNNPVYLSIDLDSGINECGTLALINFGRFMTEMKFDLITAVTTEKSAEEHDREFVTCENKPKNTVFILTVGNESGIYQDEENPNCYVLSVNNCEDIEVVEKLQIATLARFTNEPL